MTIRRSLFAARLINHTVDVDWTQHGSGSFVSDYNHPVTARRDKHMIHRRDRVFVPIRSPNGKRSERHSFHSFANIRNHNRLYQKLPLLHYLLAVEPDVEIATYAVDVRFGSPVRAGVLGVWMAKRNVHPGNLFVL